MALAGRAHPGGKRAACLLALGVLWFIPLLTLDTALIRGIAIFLMLWCAGWSFFFYRRAAGPTPSAAADDVQGTS